MLNTLPHQATLPQQKGDVLNTLPQHQSTEEAWHQAGPEFRQGQTRFHTYGNDFDTGVVLPDYIGPRPLDAPMHTTTNINKPPDIRVDDKDIIPLRTVAFDTKGFPDLLARRSRAGFRMERRLGPGLPVPPRRANLLGGNSESPQGKGSELTVINTVSDTPAKSRRSPKSHLFSGRNRV